MEIGTVAPLCWRRFVFQASPKRKVKGVGMKTVVFAAVVVASLLAIAPAAMAADSVWVGRDVDSGAIWTCTPVGGDDMVLKRNGKSYGTYEIVSSNGGVIDLEDKSDRKYRLRISRDTMSINAAGTRFQWVPLAKGTWR
jgi:hypothetical protein